jgi:filamentous hemagglutinin family protein
MEEARESGHGTGVFEAASEGTPAPRRNGDWQRMLLATTALGSVLLIAPVGAFVFGSGIAWANPAGGVVVGGEAAIQHAPGVTTIDQASQRALINWQQFSIAPGELTQFRQPGAEAIALNRVVGNDASQIMGALKANGQVWLINPNGILFGPNARIDVHGILATTTDIADDDFMAGRYNFNRSSPNPAAAVVNQGTISIGEKGLGALVAPHVRNDGVIAGRLGQVVLAGADTFTLDFYGDGLVQFATTPEVKEALEEQGALVSNDGTISADGGTVLITAAAASDVVDEVINVAGVIEAKSVAMQDGVIVLDGGDNGIVHLAGTLDASGPGAGEKGGTVKVLGEKVALVDGARIDVSGDAGGGEALIGGNYQGRGPERNAERTDVFKKARVKADALRDGDGGRVIVWADDYTRFDGSISARGGAKGGDGGFVETSSKGKLEITSTPDASAPNGAGGTWLIDPTNITIVAGDGGSLGTNTVGNILINNALSGGTSVTLDTSTATGGSLADLGNITQNADAPITKAGAGVGSLALLAENDIALNSTIAAVPATGTINWLNVSLVSDTDQNGTGSIVINGNINTNGGAFEATGVSILGTLANIATSSRNLPGEEDIAIQDSGDVRLFFAGDVVLNNIDSGFTDSPPMLSGDITITSSGGRVQANRIQTTSVGAFAGAISIQAAGDVITGPLFASSLNLDGPGNTGGSGGITVVSSSGNVITGGLLSPSEAAFGSSGDSGPISVTANNGGITVNGLVWAFSNALTGGGEGRGDAGRGGAITLRALNDIVLLGDGESPTTLQSKSLSENGVAGAGGPISMTSVSGNISISGGTSSFSSGTDGGSEAGAISITAAQNIDVNAINASGTENGALSLNSSGANIILGGRITSGTLNASAGNNVVINIADGAEGPAFQADTHTVSAGGQILNPGGGSLFSDLISLTAGSGIGTAEQAIFTDGQATLSADVTGSAGGIFVQHRGNTENLVVDSTSSPGGDVTIESLSGLVISGPISAGGAAIELLAIEDSGIAVNAPITAENGSVFIGADGDVTLNVDIQARDEISIDAQNMTQASSAALIADQLFFDAGEVRLNGPNQVNRAAGTGDIIEFRNIGDLVAVSPDLGSEVPRSFSAQEVTLQVEGVLTVVDPLETFDFDTIVLNTQGFVNAFEGEGQALQPGPGRFLVYSTRRPSEDDRGALDEVSDIIQGTFAGNPPGSITPPDQNFFIYPDFGTLTFTAIDRAVVYGDALALPDPPIQDIDYTVRFSEGDALPTDPFSGAPSLDSDAVVDTAGLVTTIGEFSVVIGPGSLVSDFSLEFENGTLVVEPAPLQAVVQDASREYGDANPPFTATYSGFVFDQDEAVLGSQAFQTDAVPSSNVGGGPNEDGSFSIQLVGFENPNYTIDPNVNGAARNIPGALTITPAPLQAVVQDASRGYGDANPPFAATYSGFKLDQSEAVLGSQTFQTDAVPSSGVGGGLNEDGSFPIQLVGFENPNYTIDPNVNDAAQNIPGALTITPAPLTGRPVARREYGEANTTAIFDPASVSGFKLDDGFEDLGRIDFTTDAAPASAVAGSPYPLTVTGIANTNYTVGGLQPGEFRVTPAPLTVQADDASRLFGAPNPPFTATFTGFKLAEGPEVVTGLQFSTTAEPSSPSGEYPIVPFGATAPNYSISFADGTLTIENISPEDIPTSALPGTTISTLSLLDSGGDGGAGGDSAGEAGDAGGIAGLNVAFGMPETGALTEDEELLFSSGGNESFWGPSVAP